MALYQPIKQGSVRGTACTSSSALMHPLTTPCAVSEKGPGQCIYLMSLVWFVKINGFYCCTVLGCSGAPGLVPSCPIPCHWYSVRVCGSLQGEKEVLGAQGEIASLGWLFTLKPLREAKCHGENTKVWDFII